MVDVVSHKFMLVKHKFNVVIHKFNVVGHKFNVVGHKFNVLGHKFNVVGHDSMLYKQKRTRQSRTNTTIENKCNERRALKWTEHIQQEQQQTRNMLNVMGSHHTTVGWSCNLSFQ